MCLAVMKCDRGKSNVCIYALLNYSGLSAEARCLFSVLMRASLLGAVAVAFANFTHARTCPTRKASLACVSLRVGGGSLCLAFTVCALGEKQLSWKRVWFCSLFKNAFLL